MSKLREGADLYDSILELANSNDPRALAVRLIGMGKEVLELGPATGRVTRVLKERGCRVTAIERDGAMAHNLEPYCSRLIIGDIERLSVQEIFARQQFDVILAGDFLEHLSNPLKVLQELRACLSPDGYVVASIPNIAHGSVRLSLLHGKFEYREIGILDQTHLRFFTLDGILRLFAEAGFAILDVQRIRQDPFKEPYIDGPRLDDPALPAGVKELIERDPDASTVQFVVKAVPINSSAAHLHAVTMLIQEKEKAAIAVEHGLRRMLDEKSHEITALRRQVAQQAGAARILEQRVAEQEGVARALKATNEQLLTWLQKYKDAKEKLLPTGSFRDRIVRTMASRFLRSPYVSSGVAERTENGARTEMARSNVDPRATVDPPPEWVDDHELPSVVIAIPNWNRVNLLRRCIKSIFANTAYPRHRICVYDQGSSDGSREYLQSLKGQVDVLLGDKNIGFVDANNVMIRRYAKWDVVFLNNDTEVTAGWLDRLVETAYKAENIGLIGSKLIYPDGRLQEAGSEVFQDGSARAYGKYEQPFDPRFNQLREVDYCSAACLYAKRSVLDVVGGFDPRYSPAYYEDSDLAFAVRTAGFKVLYEPRSAVIHHEYSTSGGTAFDRMEANRLKFREKWAAALKDQPKSLWEAVSPSRRDKVLVISNIVPAPDRSSGGTRLFEFLLLLSRRYHVVFAYTDAFSVHEYAKPLESHGITVFYPGYAKAVNNYDLDLGGVLRSNEFKLIFCELFTIAEQYLETLRESCPGTPIVVDTFDVHFLRENREAILAKDETLLRKADETKDRELAVYKQADLVLTVTEEDKQTLLREEPRLNISVVPNIHAIPPTVAPRENRRDLLFVGGFSHKPNVDAVLYFCQQIFPMVLKRCPELRCCVVGNAPPSEIVALASERVMVTGYVPHLAPYLESALVSVAPLRFGSGMKGKIGEAMAWGLPVVTTTIGAEGMDLQDGKDALIGDTPEDFADQIIDLCEDADLWNSIARNGRARVQREWSPDAVEKYVADALSCVNGDKIAAAS